MSGNDRGRPGKGGPETPAAVVDTIVTEVLGRIGTAGLRWAVEFDALVIVAPDYIVTPEGVELGPFMTEWTETLGAADVNGERFTVYYLSDDVAEWALESLTGRRQ